MKVSTQPGKGNGISILQWEYSIGRTGLTYDISSVDGNPFGDVRRVGSCQDGSNAIVCEANDPNPLCNSNGTCNEDWESCYLQAPGVDAATCGDATLHLC